MMKDTDFLFETTPGMQTLDADLSRPYSPEFYPDIPYIQRETHELRFQLLSTAQPGDKRPLMIYIQGSGWMPQPRFRFLPKLFRFAMEGYVVASIEYRPATVALFPAQILDTRAAIRYLCQNAGRYGIDPGRIAVFGDSSGGHTALLTAFAQGEMFEENGQSISGIRCVVDFYGLTNFDVIGKYPSELDHVSAQSMEARLLGGMPSENPDLVRAADPCTYISPQRQLPPTLIMHGNRDATVPFNQSLLLYEKLRKCGQSVEFYKVRGAGHGPGMWCDSVLDVVSSFLQTHL